MQELQIDGLFILRSIECDIQTQITNEEDQQIVIQLEDGNKEYINWGTLKQIPYFDKMMNSGNFFQQYHRP
jgi:hypothetical protein